MKTPVLWVAVAVIALANLGVVAAAALYLTH